MKGRPSVVVSHPTCAKRS
uniref:Uncharacterized protein n=1 Tax=Arundo donax TaxID=35708 RepID=A0A0A9GYL2_ARUDO